MRVLVTGGAGFIGSAFARQLLTQYPHYEIRVLDKLTYAGNMHNLASISHSKHFSFIHGTICDPQTVTEAMTGCDAVVHFAAETHVDRSLLTAEDFISTNVQGTYLLLETAHRLHIQRFMHISTDEVYGNALSPSGESRPSLETDPFLPLSPYAASKAAADSLAFSYWAAYGLPVVITRCSNNYGPYQYPEKQLPLFILNALENRPLPVYGDGRHSRDWIHVSDHVSAINLLLHADASQVNGEIFNIGAHAEYTTLQNATSILNNLGKPDSLLRFVADRPGHVRRHAVDTTKICRITGWQPSINFATGLQQTIQWYRDNPVWIATIEAKQNAFLHRALHLAE